VIYVSLSNRCLTLRWNCPRRDRCETKHDHEESDLGFWDSELDEISFGDRWWLRISELQRALKIEEAQAMEILADVPVSSKLEAVSSSTKCDEIEAFGLALKDMLEEHRGTVSRKSEAPLSRPVVRYKKRHRLDPEVTRSI
jgi:hypothetical protein